MTDFGFYLVITNPVVGYAKCAEAAVRAGVKIVQLRMKHASRDAIVREALTNAAKHGHARNAAVASDPLPDGGFELTVANDGEQFDRNSAAGPAEGHYGISGMEERAARIGGRLSFGRKGAWTTVKLEVRP